MKHSSNVAKSLTAMLGANRVNLIRRLPIRERAKRIPAVRPGFRPINTTVRGRTFLAEPRPCACHRSCARRPDCSFCFDETSDGSKKSPNRRTMLRIGSLTKAFSGQVLASLAADESRCHDSQHRGSSGVEMAAKGAGSAAAQKRVTINDERYRWESD